jgi:glutamate racemase
MLGIYDSGLGGVTVLKELLNLSPNTKIVYLGDTKNCPLGEKTDEQITEIVKNGVEFLFSKGCNLVILACNTATAVTIREIQNQWLPKYYPDKKVLGIIKPTIELLAENQIKPTDQIAIFATPATINSNFYKNELGLVGYNNQIQIPFLGLADSIEKGNYRLSQSVIKTQLENHTAQFTDLKAVVLACTHYPIVKDLFEQELAKLNLRPIILDQSKSTAQKLIDYTKNHPEYSLKPGKLSIFTSSDQTGFEKKLQEIFDIPTTN